MFDFRYHALSLAAVFIALAVGLLLGVSIGDQELVSSAKEDVRDSLREDVRAANDESDGLRRRLDAQREFSDEVYPLLVGGRLQGRRIGLVFLGDPSTRVISLARAAIEPAGARLGLVAVVREPVDVEGIAAKADGTRYTSLPDRRGLVDDFGARIGEQLVTGGRLVRAVGAVLLRSRNGALGNGLDGVVVMRDAPELDGRQGDDTAALEDGLMRGLVDTGTPAIGVEAQTTDPSQVTWYRDRGLSSVDDLNLVAGQAALVFTLGGAEGAFGVKPTRQALLPSVVDGDGSNSP